MDIGQWLVLLSPETLEGRELFLNAFVAYLLSQGLGLGGKLLARFFEHRFKHSEPAEIKMAITRLGPVLTTVAVRVREARITMEQLDLEFSKPEIVDALHAAFNASVETDDPLKQETLAKLIVDRLQERDESLTAIATRRAIEAMRDVNSEHLKALALIEILRLNVREHNQKAYSDWLDKHLVPIIETPVSENTVSHLCSLGLIDYDWDSLRVSDGHLPTILNAASLKYPNFFFESPVVARISKRAAGDPRGGVVPLNQIAMRPSGVVLGLACLKVLVDIDASLERS